MCVCVGGVGTVPAAGSGVAHTCVQVASVGTVGMAGALRRAALGVGRRAWGRKTSGERRCGRGLRRRGRRPFCQSSFSPVAYYFKNYSLLSAGNCQ